MAYFYTDDDLTVQVSGYLNTTTTATGMRIWSNRLATAQVLGDDFLLADPAAAYMPELLQGLDLGGSDGDDSIIIRNNMALYSTLLLDDSPYLSRHVIRAGAGDDLISVTNHVLVTSVGPYDSQYGFLSPHVVDISGGAGDNTIRVRNTADYPYFNNSLLVNVRDLQEGDDRVYITSLSSGWFGWLEAGVDLGDGNNRLHLQGTANYVTTDIRAGQGNDVISADILAYEFQTTYVSVGDGDDRVSWKTRGENIGTIEFDLGEGKNQLNFSGDLPSYLGILGGSGNDLVILQPRLSGGGDVTVDLGGGRNTFKLTGYMYSDTDITAAGTNRIDLAGAAGEAWWSITLGDGADTILLGAGSYNVTAGGGADRVQLSSDVLENQVYLLDLFEDEGDILALKGFDLPGNGVFRSLDDVRELVAGEGDVISLTEDWWGRLQLVLATDEGASTLTFGSPVVSPPSPTDEHWWF